MKEDALVLLESETLTTSPLTPQSWSGSLTLYSDSPRAAAAAPKSHFRIGHSLLLSSSCETGAKGTELVSSLLKLMKSLQKPLLNLVQGQFKGRSRENEADENKRNWKR